jgi:hypothetical protein
VGKTAEKNRCDNQNKRKRLDPDKRKSKCGSENTVVMAVSYLRPAVCLVRDPSPGEGGVEGAGLQHEGGGGGEAATAPHLGILQLLLGLHLHHQGQDVNDNLLFYAD